MNASHSRGLSMQFQLDLLRESLGKYLVGWRFSRFGIACQAQIFPISSHICLLWKWGLIQLSHLTRLYPNQSYSTTVFNLIALYFLDDKTITNYHCQKIAQKIQGGTADLPLECRQYAKPNIKFPTPPTSGNLQQKINVGPGAAKPAVVSPFEGMRGGPGRVYHAQVQRRLTSTRRFSKN